MSDSSEPLSTSSATLPPDAPDHYPKRLHGASDGANGCADAVKQEAASAAEQPESGEPEPPQKRVKVELDPGSELDIRFLISSKDAGGIIGKGGANINHLRKDYKSTVTIPDCPGPERVLSVGTRLDVLSDLLKEITQYMDDQQKSPEAEVELRLLIHTSHAGGIIGRGGQKIKELREETRCAIKVFTQCCPQSTERVCAVQGPVDVVIHAIRVVLDVIVATNIKGTVKLYDPFNYDAFAAAEYGGFGDPALVSPSGRPVPSRGPTGSSQRVHSLMDPSRPWEWNRVPGHRPGAYQIDRRDLQLAGPPAASYQRWSAPDGRHRSMPHMADAYWSDSMSAENNAAAALTPHAVQWAAWSMGQPADPADLITNPDGSASATLTVPNNVAGAIIGKGGSRIRLVRKDSGADISIENGSGLGSDRKVVVKGNVNQVRMAYSLLQQSIAENASQ